MKPEEIEKKSFEIIQQELDEIYHIKLPSDVAHIIKRVIHTTADFSFAESLYFSPGFADEISKILSGNELEIVCDTNMAMSGINKSALKKIGATIRCYMSDEKVAALAKSRQTTRACVSMEQAAKDCKNPVFVVGNAPTALFSIYELYEKGLVHPKLLIAAPVGFVNVVEAKELVMKMDIPMVVARGRRGGSNVAAAIMNAILYQSGGREHA